MAPLFVQISVSTDGYIEAADEGLDWFTEDQTVDPFATDTLGQIGGMVFGRTAHAPIALFAGASAVRAALDAGLVDELRLIRYPVLLGRGTPLFDGHGQRRDLVLAKQRQFPSGAVLSRYAMRHPALADAQ